MKKFYYSIWFYLIIGIIGSTLLFLGDIYINSWKWSVIFFPFLIFVMCREDIGNALNKYFIAQKARRADLLLKKEQEEKNAKEKLEDELDKATKRVKAELKILGFTFHEENYQSNPDSPTIRSFYATGADKQTYLIKYNNHSGHKIECIN